MSNAQGTSRYGNPFVEDPRHNALFTLARYQTNLDKLKDVFKGRNGVADWQYLSDTLSETKIGLQRCTEYVTLIGDKAEGFVGTIEDVWKAIRLSARDVGKSRDLGKKRV
jgi:hypothetical protein